MNRLISVVKNFRIRQIIVVFLVGFMFLFGQAFSYDNAARADVVTPEGTYYKGIPDNRGELRNDTQIRNAQNNLKGAVDNVRQKLNLDEQTPRATREFFDGTKNRAADKTNRLERDTEGYYQYPPNTPVRNRD
ncbi:hypothetical protein [Nostoc sp. 2RC]|jgi:hypothetical protein|uniref:hypothetical protein n=1 Tax=Nostoc sp. 2RC TaxID=2485484 RepID=UPI0016248DAA|nr:hypothetical protein [Nostoc sp. 2RC]MBC1235989.1 hypothetical protein [Nostoc sp. 2RC]